MSIFTPYRIIIMMLTGLMFAYSILFNAYEKHTSITDTNISHSLPTPILNVIGHSYLNQFIAEVLFIKTAVFYGGLNKRINEESLHIMARHFTTISQLHPRLLDTYYRSESVLAHQGNEHVNTANLILEHGREYLPKQVTLPFFEGFNYFHYLNKPDKAANVLHIASSIDGAPQWIGHLASMLMASGGNIRTGLIWLKAIERTSQDEDEKTRYQQEILTFEKAMQVQLALEQYNAREGNYPKELIQLIPVDLGSLPNLGSNFQLKYQTPELRIQRHPSEQH